MDVARLLAPSGTLRASINLGNPVLAQGTPEAPRGVTVDLARDLGARLGLPVAFHCFDAARDSFAAVVQDRADLCFLAIDPARSGELAFTAPYAVIEGVYAVPQQAAIAGSGQVDAAGVRVGVKTGSAYDLFLTRTLAAAAVVRGVDGTAVTLEQGLEVAAGIRAPVAAWAAEAGWRVLEPPFMQIEQAVAVRRDRPAELVAFLRTFVEERKADGFVTAALAASGRRDARVAAPASA